MSHPHSSPCFEIKSAQWPLVALSLRSSQLDQLMQDMAAKFGEQVDFLRFIPPAKPQQRWRWWAAFIAGGPGWIVIGAI